MEEGRAPLPKGRPARGMVACPEPLAAEVGAEVLRRGGNAVDAGVATAFAQAVVNPLLASLGGCGQFLVYRADRGQAEVVQASPVSGSGAVPGVYEPIEGTAIPGIVGEGRKVEGDRNLRGHSASVIPTLLRGLEEVHRRHGSLPWGELVAPAARLARDGFMVAPYLYATWDPDRPHPMGAHPAEKIAATPDARAIFMPAGRLLRPGKTLVQRDLAGTLDRIAAHGAGIFYEGEIGALLARDFELHGGLWTGDDLRWAHPVIEPPLRGRYRDLTILTDQPPGLGIILLEILQALDGTDLRRLGWNSPAYLDLLARTMQAAFGAAVTTLAAGGTTHLAVIDAERNVASWVHSSGSGSGVVTPGLGFVHNDHMVMFNPRPGRPDSIAPRTVPVHGGGPVIVERAGRPFMAIGSPAGALKTTALAQVLLGVVEFGLPLQAAISSPRIHTQHEARVVMVEPSFPSGLRKALEQCGHKIIVSEYTARVSAVMMTDDGMLTGGADPRGGGGLEWC